MSLIFEGHTSRHCRCWPEIERDCAVCLGTGREYVRADVFENNSELVRGLDALATAIHNENRVAGWWTDLTTGEDMLETRNRGEMLMLAVTELSEAEMAASEGLNDDKLPQYHGLHVEVADCAIRLLDQLGAEARRYKDYPLVVNDYIAGTITCRTQVCSTYSTVRDGLMLIVRDLSRALDEGYRKGKPALARYWMSAALLRIVSYCAMNDIALFEIIEAKRAFNRQRADHKPENRKKAGGKLI